MSPKRPRPTDQSNRRWRQIPAMARRGPLAPRRLPLRFMWQMDADGRFSLGSDEFTA